MDKINVTAQQRRNAESALYEMWPSIPEENVDLDDWVSRGKVQKPDCETVACFGGWCAVWPPFIAQGVYALHSGCPAMRNSDFAACAVSRLLFGVDYMFEPPNKTEEDVWTTDKDTITQRLQKLIKDSEVVDG